MAKLNISHKELVSILDYNPKTGIFTWRERPLKYFKDEHCWKVWNTRYAGKKAGCLKDNGYIVIGIKNKNHYAHILAYIYMTGKQPKNTIDHKNQISNDNRWVNLREATQQQQQRNTKVSKNNKCGLKGVCLIENKCSTVYRAIITVNSKSIYLGKFKTPEEAHAAYCEAAQELFGEFASFN
jgi:hypothetical protein